MALDWVGLSIEVLEPGELPNCKYVALKGKDVAPILVAVPPDGDIEWARRLLLDIIVSTTSTGCMNPD